MYCRMPPVMVLVWRAQMRGVHVTLRMRLECRIVRRGSDGRAGLEEVYEVLNEVVVDRGANPFLTKIECWERDRLITKVWQQAGCTCTHSTLEHARVTCGGTAWTILLWSAHAAMHIGGLLRLDPAQTEIRGGDLYSCSAVQHLRKQCQAQQGLLELQLPDTAKTAT